MPNDTDTDADRTTRSRRALSRIADALGKPRHAFYEAPCAPAELASLIELVRLWDGLKCSGDRDKLLAVARTLASAAESRGQAAE